jgi:hypothetical protein
MARNNKYPEVQQISILNLTLLERELGKQL